MVTSNAACVMSENVADVTQHGKKPDLLGAKAKTISNRQSCTDHVLPEGEGIGDIVVYGRPRESVRIVMLDLMIQLH